MQDWKDNFEFAALSIFILLILYITIRMIYNRVKDKDELDGLFRFRFKRRK
jgi:hypothetical protein